MKSECQTDTWRILMAARKIVCAPVWTCPSLQGDVEHWEKGSIAHLYPTWKLENFPRALMEIALLRLIRKSALKGPRSRALGQARFMFLQTTVGDGHPCPRFLLAA